MKLRLKKRISFLFKIVFVGLSFYLTFGLVFGQNQVCKKKMELREVNANLEHQKSKNKDLKTLLKLAEEKNPDYIEHIARQVLGYVKQNEKVFINIAGD